MKETPSKEKDIKTRVSPPASNIFYNSIIVLLGAVIIFMLYSIVAKLNTPAKEPEQEKPRKAAAIVQVEVMNGCGASGVADKFTNYLRTHNFDVVQIGNYLSFDVENSMVIDRTGNLENAKKVAEATGIDSKNVIQQINNDYFLDVTLVIGKDYNKLKPIKDR